ncbi:hypothetical protein RHMOL_Rhmol02G0203000 [Rhododendron molle]|uniref:Uncharacterized protein n=1 Tax=Rhododendron molle TaxID=49168 RepID=A0ACC0PRV4_RHOML|nr:hypothetical protein RHMOL_Rhmol02G0203000 [Rhododendron molle]
MSPSEFPSPAPSIPLPPVPPKRKFSQLMDQLNSAIAKSYHRQSPYFLVSFYSTLATPTDMVLENYRRRLPEVVAGDGVEKITEFSIVRVLDELYVVDVSDRRTDVSKASPAAAQYAVQHRVTQHSPSLHLKTRRNMKSN